MKSKLIFSIFIILYLSSNVYALDNLVSRENFSGDKSQYINYLIQYKNDVKNEYDKVEIQCESINTISDNIILITRNEFSGTDKQYEEYLIDYNKAKKEYEQFKEEGNILKQQCLKIKNKLGILSTKINTLIQLERQIKELQEFENSSSYKKFQLDAEIRNEKEQNQAKIEYIEKIILIGIIILIIIHFILKNKRSKKL